MPKLPNDVPTLAERTGKAHIADVTLKVTEWDEAQFLLHNDPFEPETKE